MNNAVIVGVDIGGSHITAALVNMADGSILPGSWKRREVNSRGKAAEVIREWTTVIRNSIPASQDFPLRIGIAMPGPFNYEEGICLIRDQHKYDELYGLNVKELLCHALHIQPDNITLSNDAECFLRGEVYAGAARGYQQVIGITLGTGLGSSLYNHGKLTDANLWCSPFKESIAEDYLSTRWFVQRYQALAGVVCENVKQMVEKGKHKIVKQVFAEFGNNLGQFLMPVIRKEEVSIVVIGGNIAQVSHLFQHQLESFLKQQEVLVKIATAQLGEQALLIGAASTCLQESMA